MRYNSSNAYDFSMFEQREYAPAQPARPAQITKLQPKRQKNVKPQSAAKAKFMARVKILAGIGLVVGLSMFMIFLRVEVGQQESEIRRARAEITALESEENRLRMQLESLMSIQNVEIEAVQIGMQPATRSQRVYVRLNRSQNPTQHMQASQDNE